MSLDAAALGGTVIAQDAAYCAFAADPSASILKHAVKIWARDHGFTEDEVENLTEQVVAFTCSAILAYQRKVQAVA